jgi:phospholipase/lecithinase/hemolysin
LNLRVNFAFSGAQTGVGNTVALFAPEFAQVFAAAGLELPGVFQQLDWAKATLYDVDPDQDLFWLWAGTNDVLAGADPLLARDNIGIALNRMYDELGARTIVVPNLFDVGRMPIIGELGPEVQAAFHELTLLHNSLLQGVVAEFLVGHPDVTVIPVEVFSVIEESISDFVDPTGQCIVPPFPPELPTCDDFFFFDNVHPRSVAWEPVVENAFEAINATTTGKKWRRIITLGDSFSDVECFDDSIRRSIGFDDLLV